MYGHRISSWLFIRIVFIQSHRIVLLTHSLLYIATPGHVAKIWEFSSAGGLTWTCVQGVLSCPSVRWGGLSGRAFRGALATLVLDVAQSSICISACACVVCMASLFASTKSDPLNYSSNPPLRISRFQPKANVQTIPSLQYRCFP